VVWSNSLTMSTGNSLIITEHPRADSLGFWRLALTLGMVLFVPIAALAGGMPLLVMALALGLAVCVWRDPAEAPGAGMLFLFAAQILLPSSARIYSESTDISQMYIWAVGLLIITLAAIIRIGPHRVFDIPLSAQTFLVVALGSAIYAATHGAEISYVLRQFYGILLLIAYLGIGLREGNEELVLSRSRFFGVFCALCFIVYYLAIFGEYGFHKEMGTSGAQASVLAILLVIAGIRARKMGWVWSGLILLSVPALLFQRRDLVAFLAALPIAYAFQSKTWKMRLALGLLATLLALPGIFPQIAQSVGDQLNEVPIISEMIPSSAQDSSSLYERAVQVQFALEAVVNHPWLGEGLGSTFQWDSPIQGSLEGGYVDNGWAYLFQKMGLLGAGAFLWFLITIFKAFSCESAGLTACLLSAALVTMFSEPIFFHFTTAPFIGTFAGVLLARKDRVRKIGGFSDGNRSRNFTYRKGRGFAHG